MKFKKWHAIAFIFIAVWLAYYPALFAPLNPVDDLRMVTEMLNRPSFDWHDILFPKSVTYYRPLISGSFLLSQFFWNLETPFLHFENILLHWLNASLVFVMTRLVLSRLNFDHVKIDDVKIPLTAALIFALHPLNTEAVIWIAGRADLMAATFVLLCLIATFRFLQTCKWPWLILVFLFFFAGCLSKETALFALTGVALFSWLLSRDFKDRGRPVWLTGSPLFVCLLASGGYFVLRRFSMAQRDLGLQHVAKMWTLADKGSSYDQTLTETSLGKVWETIQNVLSVAGFYLRKIFQPFPLNFGIIDVPSGYFWLGCLLVLLSFFLIVKLTWPSCFILTAISLGSIALLVAMGDISWTPIAERYMYAPIAMTSIGITLAGAVRLERTKHNYWRKIIIYALLPLFFLSGIAVVQRGLLWQDNLLLFSDTIVKSPGFDLARNEIASLLWQKGRKTEALNIVRSLEVPKTQQASLNKVLVFMEEGRLDEAREFLLDKLQSDESIAYRVAILERLDNVLEMMREQTNDPELIKEYNAEREGYLHRLFKGTGDPFYLYRMGHLQLMSGDKSGAQKSFATAHNLFAEDSPYKSPAGELAEKLERP